MHVIVHVHVHVHVHVYMYVLTSHLCPTLYPSSYNIPFLYIYIKSLSPSSLLIFSPLSFPLFS